MDDLALLLRLRRRHAWTELVFWGYAAGVDLDAERGWFDRLYLVYLLAILLAWALASVAVVTTMTAEALAGLSTSTATLVVRVVSLAPVAAAFAAMVTALRKSPVQLSAADIAYLGASPVSTSAIFGLQAAVQTLKIGLIAFGAGYLLAFGLAATGLGTAPVAGAATIALVAMVVAVGRWVAGAARLSLRRRLGLWMLVGLVLASVLVAGLVNAVRLALTGASVLGCTVMLVIVLLAEVLLLRRFAARADMSRVIAESGTYAELQPLRLLRRFDPGAYRAAARRTRLASRRPRFGLPLGDGPLTPVSRAVQSYARQPGTLLRLLAWGGVVVPAGVLIVLWNASPLAFVPWISVSLAGLSAELTRVFKEDTDRPSIRRMLPLDTLPLLLLGSLPALLLSVAASIVAIVFAYGAGPGLVAGLSLAVLLNLLAVLCRGLGMLQLPRLRRVVSFELSMFVGLLLVALSALEPSPWSPVAAAFIAVAAVLGLLRTARE